MRLATKMFLGFGGLLAITCTAAIMTFKSVSDMEVVQDRIVNWRVATVTSVLGGQGAMTDVREGWEHTLDDSARGLPTDAHRAAGAAGLAKTDEYLKLIIQGRERFSLPANREALKSSTRPTTHASPTSSPPPPTSPTISTPEFSPQSKRSKSSSTKSTTRSKTCSKPT